MYLLTHISICILTTLIRFPLIWQMYFCFIVMSPFAMSTISTTITISFRIRFLFWQTTYKNTFRNYLYGWSDGNIWECVNLSLFALEEAFDSLSPLLVVQQVALPCFSLLYSFWYLFILHSFSQFYVSDGWNSQIFLKDQICKHSIQKYLYTT